jgi:hypothetical protein
MAYREHINKERQQALDTLTAMSQEEDMGY